MTAFVLTVTILFGLELVCRFVIYAMGNPHERPSPLQRATESVIVLALVLWGVWLLGKGGAP
jgi:hypothetical protein